MTLPKEESVHTLLQNEHMLKFQKSWIMWFYVRFVWLLLIYRRYTCKGEPICPNEINVQDKRSQRNPLCSSIQRRNMREHTHTHSITLGRHLEILIQEVGNVPRWNSSSWYGSRISMAMTCSLKSSPLLLFSLIIAQVALEHLYLKRLQPSQTDFYLEMAGCFPRRLLKDFKHLAISQKINSSQVHVPLATYRVTL